jgi:basic membrane protein A
MGKIVAIVVVLMTLGSFAVELPGTAQKTQKIGIVSDLGGRGDLSFNDMAFKGAQMAKNDFGTDIVEVISITESDYLPNLRMLAERGDCALIVAVGFLLADSLEVVAKEFPDQKFAIVDAEVDAPNVVSILFKENEGSALAGALAALIAAEYGYKSVGTALGIEIPDLWKFEIGYKWGVDWGVSWYEKNVGGNSTISKTPKRERVLWTYTGSFSDPGKGYQAAKAQLGQGSGVVFQVGGQIGTGVFRAVRETCKGKPMGPPFAIGVDSDQDWVEPGYIIASMMKRVDTGVYMTIESALKGTFKGGLLELGLKEDGVGLSSLEDLDEFLEIGIQAGTIKKEDRDAIHNKIKAARDSLPSYIWDAVKELEDQIREGKSNVPKPLTKDDMNKYRAIYG